MRKIFIKLKIVSRLYSYVYCTIFLCAGQNLINFVGFLSRSTRSFFFFRCCYNYYHNEYFFRKSFPFLRRFLFDYPISLEWKMCFLLDTGIFRESKEIKTLQGIKETLSLTRLSLETMKKTFSMNIK